MMNKTYDALLDRINSMGSKILLTPVIRITSNLAVMLVFGYAVWLATQDFMVVTIAMLLSLGNGLYNYVLGSYDGQAALERKSTRNADFVNTFESMGETK